MSYAAVSVLGIEAREGNMAVVSNPTADMPFSKRARSKKESLDQRAESTAALSESQPSSQAPRVSAVGKSDKPAKQDSLDRAIYVNAIAALIRNENTQAPLTIGIYGPWGSGKSSFLSQLADLLRKRHYVISFNPWRLSSGGEVWAGLIKEIAPIVDRHLGPWQRLRFLWSSDSTRDISKLHTRVAAAGKKVGNWLTLATASGGFLAATHLQDVRLPDFMTKIIASLGLRQVVDNVLAALGAADLQNVKWGTVIGLITALIVGVVVLFKIVRTLLRPFSTQFEANQSHFKKDSQAMKNATFKDFEALRKVIGDFAENRAKSRKPHLVLLIDDLDRCPPDRVVDVLEAVNLFVAELPIITVFAIDTKFVCSAVAARHCFLFGPQDGLIEKEGYGRLFLEKIIHIPFQLPAVQSYKRYVSELVTVAGAPASITGAEDEVARRASLPSVRELTQGRISLSPLALYMKFMTWLQMRKADPNQRLALIIGLRLMFGIELTDEQDQWISTQDFTQQITCRHLKTSLGGKFDWSTLWLFRTIFERAREEVLSAAIQIEDSDKAILLRHIANVRGNPRSIKRFVNTYLLAKGIKDQSEFSDSETIRLEDLAAWLVLLQNWPREGSILCMQARSETQTPGRFFTDDWIERLFKKTPPNDLVAFVQSNNPMLEALASSRRGLDIARCFSFFTP